MKNTQKIVVIFNEGYKDDYFEILPIEPVEFEEDKIVMPKFNNGPGAGFGGNNKNNNNANKALTPFEKSEDYLFLCKPLPKLYVLFL